MTQPDVPGMQAGPAPTCYRHPDRPTYISCTRCGRPICPECMRPASVGFHCPEEIAEARRTVRAPRTALGGRISAGRDATTVLVGLNILVFVIMTVSGTGILAGQPSLLFAEFADVPGRVVAVTPDGGAHLLAGVAHGEVWRLLTAMFLHFGVIHLALNMYVLLLVGPPLEAALGRLRFVLLYLLAGLGGSVASFAFGPHAQIAAGASGAIFGLFGAYYVIARRIGAQTGPIVATIGLNLVISFSVAFIDVRAHVGGLVTGAAVAAVLAYAPRNRRTLVQGAGAAAVALLLAALAIAHAPAVRSADQNGLTQIRISLPAPPRAAG